MKHCVLMTAYKDAKTIERIISSLPSDWGVFIHIDKKAKISLSIPTVAKTNIIKSYNIYWGGFNHVEAFLDLMKLALKDDNKYEYFHLITGQDYPCFTKELIKTIEEENRINIECFTIPKQTWTTWEGGYSFFKYVTVSRYCDIRKGIGRILNKILTLFQKKKKNYLPDYPIYGGSLYGSLPRYAVEHIFNSDIYEDLKKKLKYSLCAEETFFQTIFMNSPYKSKISNTNYRYMDWKGPNPPKVLMLSDYPSISSRKYLFLRKIQLSYSDELLEKIDSEILKEKI